MTPARPTISPSCTSSETFCGACQPARARAGWKRASLEMQQRAGRRAAARGGIELVERPADQQLHQLGLRRVGRGDAGDPPVAHHRHPVGDLRHLLEPVRDVDDADAARAELAHDAEQPFDLADRQRRGRLVHDQDARGVGERLDDRHDLAVADREIRRPAGRRRCRARWPSSRLRASLRMAATVEEAAGPRQLAAEEEVGGDVEARNEVELLEDRGDAGGLRVARIGEAHRRAVDRGSCPRRARCTPERMFISVDLPAPFSPSSAWISPACRSKSTPRSAWTPPKRLTTPRIDKQRLRSCRSPAGCRAGISVGSRRETVRRGPPCGLGDPLDQQSGGLSADLDAGLRDQGQPRLEAVGPFEIVEADHARGRAARASPRSRTARMTPIVARLLPVTSAVGGSAAPAEHGWHAAAHRRGGVSGDKIALGDGSSLVRASAARNPIDALERRREARVAGDEADAPMSERQRHDRSARASLAILDADLVEARVGQPVDQHARQPAARR